MHNTVQEIIFPLSINTSTFLEGSLCTCFLYHKTAGRLFSINRQLLQSVIIRANDSNASPNLELLQKSVAYLGYYKYLGAGLIGKSYIVARLKYL